MPVDWGVLRRRADEQCDLLTRAQCLAAGLSVASIEWRVRSGRWTRVHPGVFLTQPGRADWDGRAMAALLFALSGARVADAALCGRSAAYLWGIERTPPTVVEVVIPERCRVVAPQGVRIRRAFRFDAVVHDLAYPWRTTAAATVLDVAATGSPLDALSIVARAVQKEVVTTAEVAQELAARAGHRHSRILRPALADVGAGGQSGTEVLYVRDVERAHGLPTAIRQAPSDRGARRYHDNGYDEFGLIVEVDGRLGHERWADRVRDGRRDRQLLVTERLTTRVFYADVVLEPCRTAAEIAAILAGRGWAGRPRRCRRTGCVVGG
ncbi:type IV toxin-antitoxin system AbiEi family antitoxin domain-containing protein [Pedococcus bigeumensis]|uniref:type IV toxin-antitoxin system AbiEi family antitoxin domain-containing protein n=1 Tax=Pedococcus bigeumensis TaxID=433644 RepID=UPI0031D48C91